MLFELTEGEVEALFRLFTKLQKDYSSKDIKREKAQEVHFMYESEVVVLNLIRCYERILDNANNKLKTNLLPMEEKLYNHRKFSSINRLKYLRDNLDYLRNRVDQIYNVKNINELSNH